MGWFENEVKVNYNINWRYELKHKNYKEANKYKIKA
jgi:hypothetical protein